MTNYRQTSLEAYIKTDKPNKRELILFIFKTNVTGQYNYHDVNDILRQNDITMPLSTIVGRLNELFNLNLIKLSKIEDGKRHYSLRLIGDPLNTRALTWKERFLELEKWLEKNSGRYHSFSLAGLKAKEIKGQ